MKRPKILVVASGIGDSAEFSISLNRQTYTKFDYIIVTDHQRHGTVKSRIMALNEYGKNYDVLAWPDTDDLLKPNALELVAKQYEDENCWLTYGNFEYPNGEVPYKSLDFPKDIHDANAYRSYDWRFIPLRTFRRELFYKLTNLDLFTDRELTAIPDANMLYCLLELCGKEHMRYIEEPIYIYNNDTPDSVVNRFSKEQIEKELAYVKGIPPKRKLKGL